MLILLFILFAEFAAIPQETAGATQTESLNPAEQRLIEQNDIGVKLIEQKKYPEAVKLFRELDLSYATPSQIFIYKYNFARALEGNENFDEAYEQYKSAVLQQPKFDPAVEGAFRILRSSRLDRSEHDKLAEAVTLIAEILDKNPNETAGHHIRESLKMWSTESRAVDLLPLLVRFYVAVSLKPEQFDRSERAFLDSVKNSLLLKSIEEIESAYSGDFQPTFEPSQEVFRAWANSRDFSRLLKKIGDFYVEREDRKRAIGRYSLAVALNIYNSDACLYAAALLCAWRGELDPDGVLLNGLVDAVLREENGAPTGSRDPDDWQDILRFHMLLARMFQNAEQWGSDSNPRSALFHWQHAEYAEEKARAHDPSLPFFASVHFGLADAYLHIGRKADAEGQYYVVIKNFWRTSPLQAKTALKRARAAGLLSDRLSELNEHVGLVFGIVAKSNNNPVFQAAKTGAEDEAAKLSKEKGVTVTIDWRTPNEEDLQKQGDAVEQLVSAGADGIAVSPSDASGLNKAINEAVAAGVPVVTFDTDAPESKRFARFGTDDIDCGQKVMAELAKEMGGKGVVAILAGNQNDPALQKRAQGVEAEAKKYPDIKILDSYYHKETPRDAAAKVEQVMQAHPEITGWAMVGGWPLFTDNALKFAPGTVKVVAVDALPAELGYLRSGHVQVLLAQQVYEWGTKSVDMLYDKVADNKNPPSSFVKGELVPITKDNVDEFGKNWEKWLPKK